MKKLFRLSLLVVLAVGCLTGCGGGGGNGAVVEYVSPFDGTYRGNFRTAPGGQDLLVKIASFGTVRFLDNNSAPLTDSFNIPGTFNPQSGVITAKGTVFYGGNNGQETTFTGTLQNNNGVVTGSGTWTITATGVNGTWSVQKVTPAQI